MNLLIKLSLRALVLTMALTLVTLTLVSNSSAAVGPPVPVCDLTQN